MISLPATMLASMIVLGSALAQESNFTTPIVRALSYGGSGCPQGTLRYYIPVNSTRLLIAFGGYAASMGTGISGTEMRKNCQVNIDLNHPPGLQYAVEGNTYSGYASLEDGVTAVHKSIYYFSGSTAQSATQSNFTGPSTTPYTITDTVGEDKIWSKCGQADMFNVNNQVRMSRASNSTGSGTLFESGLLEISLVWRTCAV
ncbi:hypothetical protein VTL71DRAFT_15739 [Oculimacula yallundae]|uniref:Secreted protein n=1 Tax=Oculimacula yallundae TaxID=86028 RepID=A0ABR4CEY3_9HELO